MIQKATPILAEETEETMQNKYNSMEEIYLDYEGYPPHPVDTVKTDNLLKYNAMDEHGEAHFNMDVIQKFARKNVFAMLKLPIILGCFCIAAIICAIQRESFLTIIASLGIIITCFEYKYELKNFKKIHKNALTCWTSSLIWKKSNRDELPEYNQYKSPRFTDKSRFKQGCAHHHPAPTQLEIYKMKINEEFYQRVNRLLNLYLEDYIGEYEGKTYITDYEKWIEEENIDPTLKSQTEGLNKIRNEALENSKELQENNFHAAMLASQEKLREFYSDLYSQNIRQKKDSRVADKIDAPTF